MLRLMIETGCNDDINEKKTKKKYNKNLKEKKTNDVYWGNTRVIRVA